MSMRQENNTNLPIGQNTHAIRIFFKVIKMPDKNVYEANLASGNFNYYMYKDKEKNTVMRNNIKRETNE